MGEVMGDDLTPDPALRDPRAKRHPVPGMPRRPISPSSLTGAGESPDGPSRQESQPGGRSGREALSRVGVGGLDGFQGPFPLKDAVT